MPDQTAAELYQANIAMLTDLAKTMGEFSGVVAENTRVCRETQAKIFDAVATQGIETGELQVKVDALTKAIEADTKSREKIEAERRSDAKAAFAKVGEWVQKYWLPFLLTAGAGGASLGGWHISKAPEPVAEEAPAAVEVEEPETPSEE